MNTTLDLPTREPVTASRPVGAWPDKVISEQQITIDALRAIVRAQKAQLDIYTGRSVQQPLGSALYEACVADAPVLLEYTYVAPERAVPDAERRDAGPGYAASVWIQRALINGHWVVAADIFTPNQIDDLEQEIVDQFGG